MEEKCAKMISHTKELEKRFALVIDTLRLNCQ